MFNVLSRFLALVSSLDATITESGDVWAQKNFKSLVAFGDSYTDESRLLYFAQNNGAAPPTGWIDPITPQASTGGYVWPRYFAWYTGANVYNYAISGSACSNDITPRTVTFNSASEFFPDVQGYEIPAFLADKDYTNPQTGNPFLDIPTDETVYSMWVGANDLGEFLNNSQSDGKTVLDYVGCVYNSLDRLYDSGARNFVLMNGIPLNLLPLYTLPFYGGLDAAGMEDVNNRMEELAKTVSTSFNFQTASEVKVANRYPDANFAVFDVYSLYNDMYHNPGQYLNGSAPLNVTGVANQCDAEGSNCVESSSPDSFLWYDELHSSEQAHRNVATEFVKVISGESSYANYWS